MLSAFHFPKADAYHLINGYSLARRPWISTLELPYSQERSKLAAALIRQDSCHGILCQSKWVYDRMVQRFTDIGATDVVRKMQVLLPPQEATTLAPEKSIDGPILFAFVGRAFRRKGGLSLLRAIDRLPLCEKKKFNLIFVTNLSIHDWPSNATQEEVFEARELISRNSGCVTHIEKMSQVEVLGLYEKAHVAIIPSFCDAQAYGALECMSRAASCITTTVGSLNEWNSTDRGWTLELQRGDRGDVSVRKKLELSLEDMLLHTLQLVLQDRECLSLKSKNAWKYVRQFHDPLHHNARLDGFYSEMRNSW